MRAWPLLAQQFSTLGKLLRRNPPVPDEHRVCRHVPKRWVLPNGTISSEAFCLKREKRERYLSSSWLEFFGGDDAHNEQRVRECTQLAFHRRDVFARVPVGSMRERVRRRFRILLAVRHIGGDNPSYSGIHRIPRRKHETVAVEIAFSVGRNNYFPADVKKTQK